MKIPLTKIGMISDNLVMESSFNSNNQTSVSGEGTPAERFFRRRVRSHLPNSFRKKLTVEDLMEIINKKRQQLAKKRGRRSVDII